ncbi:CCA tRNA nucleotidyltransferase [Holospora curviuscula]|uniref:CCA-adding enzyme n=1 Tax=Holospora curviuscula TaxID=1082868 RepID=A0A2S5R8I4_9PROT|nr:CCA tRNA nucleotidyltransferase [Holospora curviuscula]PPE03628.1 CCA-adding enzyme [Holospora curviuscula]
MTAFKNLHRWPLNGGMNTVFEWLKNPGPQALFSCFKGKAEIRFVGGCVRNSLLGIPLKDDFDLAITCPPYLTMKFLQDAGITAIPTGIKHGTVSAIIEGIPYEITTLRTECSHDGRHAMVQFTHDWIGDAMRRDFTINALYVDAEGEVFDVVQGREDLDQGIVRFIGDPDGRIQEDYLRILRFFRIHAYYGKGPLNAQAFLRCCRWKHMLGILSKERITKEFFKLLDASNPWYVIGEMVASGILSQLLQAPLNFFSMEAFERATGYVPEAWVRWVSLTNHSCPGLCLSRKQEKAFESLLNPLEVHNIRSSLYTQPSSIVLGRWWIRCAKFFATSPDKALQDWHHYSVEILSFTPVPFPLNGSLLLAQGILQRHIGTILAEVKTWWIQNEERPDQSACLSYALTVAKQLSSS